MQKKLDIQWFIEQHSDWEKLLSEKPYCLAIQRDKALGRNLVLFKYDQIESDMGLRLVRQCRGLILDEDTLEPVCVPFFKFFNAGETHADEIDWKTAWTSEKIDGSIIKVVKLGNGLLVSTNGTIDAYKAPIQDQIGFVGKTFGGLFELALLKAMENERKGKAGPDWMLTPTQWLSSKLEEGFTYMFELTSQYNKVVVSWHEPKLWFIGCRDNGTMEEIRFSDHPLSKAFDTPQVFPLTNLKEVQESAEMLDCNHEGFVVCDAGFRRNKVKSSTYVSLHHMKNNGILSYERGLEIVRGNELDEVLAYFPEFREHLKAIKAKYDAMLADLSSLEERMKDWMKETGVDGQPWLIESGGKMRKDLAVWAFKNTKLTGVVFALADHKVESAKAWLEASPTKNLCKILGLKGDDQS